MTEEIKTPFKKQDEKTEGTQKLVENTETIQKKLVQRWKGLGTVEVVLLSIIVASFSALVGLTNMYVKDNYGGDYKSLYRSVFPPSSSIAKELFGNIKQHESEDSIPLYPVEFTVNYNGDGISQGIKIKSSNFNSLNEIILNTCIELTKDNQIINSDIQCQPNNGAKLYLDTGIRIYNLKEIKQNHTKTYVVPQGILYVYPIYSNVGNVIIPESVKGPITNKPITLTQLSLSPRVFQVDNFMTEEEMQVIIQHNKDLVKPSEVGFSGWRDLTRTSYTAWDFTTWAAKDIQQRSFDLVGIEYNKDLADAVQVLRYNNSEWYKPHTDWFDSKGYDNHDPTINNGTNRFATVFLYLTDVEEGGETVFPLSTTHEGYTGEQLVHKGTEKTAGYISNADAAWVCNSSSSALRTKPKKGSAVLFYSQGPSGELDKYSLHGGCPVIKGLKWSANVWLWNRPKPSKTVAKDTHMQKEASKQIDNHAIYITFHNQNNNQPIKVYWDDGSKDKVFQMNVEPNEGMPITTYETHKFIIKKYDTDEVIGEHIVKKKNNNQIIYF